MVGSGDGIGNRVAKHTSKKQENGEWILTLVEIGQKRTFFVNELGR